MRYGSRVGTLALLLGSLLAGLVGCAAAEEWSPSPEIVLSSQDRIWLAGVKEQAARAAGVPLADAVDCWSPSQHPVNPEDRVLVSGERGQEAAERQKAVALGDTEIRAFRVLCRVSFTEDQMSRWRDTVCVGKTDATPAVPGCYEWAYYRGQPEFQDQQSYRLR